MPAQPEGTYHIDITMFLPFGQQANNGYFGLNSTYLVLKHTQGLFAQQAPAANNMPTMKCKQLRSLFGGRGGVVQKRRSRKVSEIKELLEAEGER
jgi:hypothetical protein